MTKFVHKLKRKSKNLLINCPKISQESNTVLIVKSLFIPQPQMTIEHCPSVIANLKVQISLIALPSFLLANISY